MQQDIKDAQEAEIVEIGNNLVGLQAKSRLCKICNSFPDKILNNLTLDLLLRRRTYIGICEHYTKLLPPGVADISQVNVNNHRKHCDPGLIAEKYLLKAGIPIKKGDKLTKLYSMRYDEVISKNDMLQEIYKERVSNLYVLQQLLETKNIEYNELSPNATSMTSRANKAKLQRDIKSLIINIDNIQNSLQQVLVRDIGVEQGTGNSTINVYNNVVNVFQGSLKDFMGELVPYIMLNVFPEELDKGKEVIKFISNLMDEKLGPALLTEEKEGDKVNALIKQRKEH